MGHERTTRTERPDSVNDRLVIAVVLPDGYTGASDFAADCNVEVIATFTEGWLKRVMKHAYPVDTHKR